MNILLLCIEIFLARIIDVSLGTIRTVIVVKGKNLVGSILGFFEVTVWFLVVEQALTTSNSNIFIVLSYALGFATGTYIGGIISTKLVKSKFTRITHKETIDILKKAKVKWEFEPEYGEDIAREHEKYITEYFNGPVFIKNWPKDIKAFYMKQNPDGKTVAAVDLEVPGAGELMGGSQREEDYDKLVNRMKELGMKQDELDWYLNLRKFGGCVHSGFGMGFERLLIYLTGVDNIRDVIPYPRTPGNCDY